MFKNRSTFTQNLSVSVTVQCVTQFLFEFNCWCILWRSREFHSCYCGNYLCKIKTERASERDKEAGCGRWECWPSGAPDPTGGWPVTHITHYVSWHVRGHQLIPDIMVTATLTQCHQHWPKKIPSFTQSSSSFFVLCLIMHSKTRTNCNPIHFVLRLSVLV